MQSGTAEDTTSETGPPGSETGPQASDTIALETETGSPEGASDESVIVSASNQRETEGGYYVLPGNKRCFRKFAIMY